MARELMDLWEERRRRLLGNVEVYAKEGDYAKALVTKAEADAVLFAMGDVRRICAREQSESRDQ